VREQQILMTFRATDEETQRVVQLLEIVFRAFTQSKSRPEDERG
jgi:hypothetical protein